jgi:uncharacterized membrane protein YhaH (DUF805 family)
MKLHWSDLWRTDGTLGRAPYFVLGALLVGTKFLIDWFFTARLFHLPWSPWLYVRPLTAESDWARSDLAAWLLTLVAVSLPFVWSGVALTVRRLRAADLSPWLAVLFFVPLVKFIFFLVLSLLPSQPQHPVSSAEATRSGVSRIVPRSATASAVVAMGFVLIFGVASVLFGTEVLRDYGWSLFVGLPFCMGFLAVLIHSWNEPRRFRECVGVALGSVALGALALVGFAIEGAICLLMAAPLAAALAVLGAACAYGIQTTRWRQRQPSLFLGIGTIAAPLSILIESSGAWIAPTFQVTTTVEVDAPPAKVWQQLLRFPDLAPPREWVFAAGIAYPVRATIAGEGPGAIRHCIFSTGAFVEPIEIWDEPRRLKFAVTTNPSPMREWTPYQNLHPAHLDGFLAARAGEFRLIPLSDRRTRLEGTTWYQHHLSPAGYWRFFSDYLIRRIHERVLTHIKVCAETR